MNLIVNEMETACRTISILNPDKKELSK